MGYEDIFLFYTEKTLVNARGYEEDFGLRHCHFCSTSQTKGITENKYIAKTTGNFSTDSYKKEVNVIDEHLNYAE